MNDIQNKHMSVTPTNIITPLLFKSACITAQICIRGCVVSTNHTTKGCVLYNMKYGRHETLPNGLVTDNVLKTLLTFF